ncbi:MAG TPA: N-acetylmuramoyl-L-alanine amidase [Actinomycetota bacterium]|nr:N-acetylmuramoyl-L-alanine amidase [Actinomycetota bacterium]
MTDLIREGDRSEKVTDVQLRLRSLKLRVEDDPGFFGPSTKQAVREFQQQRGIIADGIVGPHTWNELVEASWRLGDRALYLRVPVMRGDDVLALQSRLNALGFDAGREDGIFGRSSDSGVRAFQREYGVAEDGIFGPASHAALMGLRVDRPGTAARLREELRRSEGGLTDSLVVIDPGHGGDDPGDIGADGLVEADVCWELALRLAERLTAAGARVRFTRTEIESPDPSERARRANAVGASLFVSIHLNAHAGSGAEGATTFYFGGSRAGEALADKLQAELVRLDFKDCRSHARSYPVLRETRMPAVLVEPGFITHPDDEKKMQDPEFRAVVADAISVGVARYFEEGF